MEYDEDTQAMLAHSPVARIGSTLEFYHHGQRHEISGTDEALVALAAMLEERGRLRAAQSLPPLSKVVKVGRADPAWAREFDCAVCGAVVTITRSDLSVRKVHDIYGRREVVEAAAPCCGAKLRVSDRVDASWGDLPTEAK